MDWICDELIKNDFSVDQLDMAGNAPLHLAAREGHLATLGILLQNGALIERKVKTVHSAIQ